MIGRIYIIINPDIAPAFPNRDPTFGTVLPITVVIVIAIKLKINPDLILIVGSLKMVDETISQMIWNRIGKTVNI